MYFKGQILSLSQMMAQEATREEALLKHNHVLYKSDKHTWRGVFNMYFHCWNVVCKLKSKEEEIFIY